MDLNGPNIELKSLTKKLTTSFFKLLLDGLLNHDLFSFSLSFSLSFVLSLSLSLSLSEDLAGTSNIGLFLFTSCLLVDFDLEAGDSAPWTRFNESKKVLLEACDDEVLERKRNSLDKIAYINKSLVSLDIHNNSFLIQAVIGRYK